MMGFIMNDWYKSKTVWASIAVAGCGVWSAVTGQTVPEEVYAVMAAFGLYGVRDAVEKVKQ